MGFAAAPPGFTAAPPWVHSTTPTFTVYHPLVQNTTHGFAAPPPGFTVYHPPPGFTVYHPHNHYVHALTAHMQIVSDDGTLGLSKLIQAGSEFSGEMIIALTITIITMLVDRLIFDRVSVRV